MFSTLRVASGPERDPASACVRSHAVRNAPATPVPVEAVHGAEHELQHRDGAVLGRDRQKVGARPRRHAPHPAGAWLGSGGVSWKCGVNPRRFKGQSWARGRCAWSTTRCRVHAHAHTGSVGQQAMCASPLASERAGPPAARGHRRERDAFPGEQLDRAAVAAAGGGRTGRVKRWHSSTVRCLCPSGPSRKDAPASRPHSARSPQPIRHLSVPATNRYSSLW